MHGTGDLASRIATSLLGSPTSCCRPRRTPRRWRMRCQGRCPSFPAVRKPHRTPARPPSATASSPIAVAIRVRVNVIAYIDEPSVLRCEYALRSSCPVPYGARAYRWSLTSRLYTRDDAKPRAAALRMTCRRGSLWRAQHNRVAGRGNRSAALARSVRVEHIGRARWTNAVSQRDLLSNTVVALEPHSTSDKLENGNACAANG